MYLGVYKPGGWETGSRRFSQAEPVGICCGVMPEAMPKANDSKRDPYYVLIGKWVDIKFKKESQNNSALGRLPI